jgi:gliding motility-associated-like protein
MQQKWCKALVFLILLGWVALPFYSFGQAGSSYYERRGNIWLFGQATGLDFNCDPPRVLSEGGIKASAIGVSALSDECGDLMFYSDGDSIWDAAHKPLTGPGVLPLIGSNRAIQSSIILPHPRNANITYIFSVDADAFGNSNGLSYNEYEKLGPGGRYNVQNKLLVRLTNEMVSAINDGSGGFWVVTKLKNKAEFNSFHITGAGIDTMPVVSSAGISNSETGQMKFSPNGEFLAIASPLQLFKFNLSTGVVSNYSGILGDAWLGAVTSIEFSPACNYLYVPALPIPYTSRLSGFFQFDLTQTDFSIMENSAILITLLDTPKGGIQLGPDGKIYVISNPLNPKLSYIAKPNRNGSLSEYHFNEINLNFRPPGTYFPNFNQSWFQQEDLYRTTKLCSADSIQFFFSGDYWGNVFGANRIDSVIWRLKGPNNSVYTTSEFNPKYFYTAAGCYDVEQEVFSSDSGLSIRKHKLVRIGLTPEINLNPRDTTLCVQPRIMYLNAFTNNSPDATYSWYYQTFAEVAKGIGPDDPPVSVIDRVSFVRTVDEGRYWVHKTYRCCDNYDTIDVHFDSIVPQFRANDGVQCEKDNDFVFTNISVPGFVKTSWDYGNGKKDTGTIGRTHYNQLGVVYPSMTTYSPQGCKGSLTRIMLVVKHPVAVILTDTTVQCFENNVFKVRDSSWIEYGQGGLQKWAFSMGDSTFTSLKQFTKSYKKPGVYDLSLILTSSQDCRDTAHVMLKVYDQPQALFTVNDSSQCLSANNFVFSDFSSTSLDSINFRLWGYGDGSPSQNRMGKPLQHNKVYGSVDSFRVSLQVGTGPGCYDTMYKTVYVHGDPTVDFAINTPQQCLDGNRYVFAETVTVPKGAVQSLLWNFGDSSAMGSGSNPVKSFVRYGSYNVQLKAISNYGCSDSVSKSVLLHPMPQAGFTVTPPISCFKGHSFSFSAAPSFIPVGSIAAYNWDFGDGNVSAVANPPAKTYAKDTGYTVSLALTSDKGCMDTVSKKVGFYPTPVAVATVDNPIQCLEENLFYYKGDKSIAPGGVISDFLWQFGDGTIDESDNPGGKFYVKPDSMMVLLKVTTADGCTDTASLFVKVLPSPVANFTVEPTCLFQPSQFKNKSSSSPGKITGWSWSLGDGTQTNDSTPVHTYSNTGAYTVSLSVESNYGCRAKVTKINEAVVKALPEARFGFEKTDFDERNTTIQFYDSSIDADQWFWSLGIGGVSTQQNPLIQFNDTATLPIELVIRNKAGCTDTIDKTVFVAPDFFFYVPNAFTPNRDDKNPTFGGEGTIYYKEYFLKIFNRWGQQVFYSDSPLVKWDGSLNGQPCPDGLYTYVYRLRDVFGFYHNYSGSLMLIR